VPRSHSLADRAFSRAAGAPLIDGNEVSVHCDAQESYPAWLDAIGRAERWIHFESYIIRDDKAGRQFSDALIARARAGVQVRLLYDWLGALGASPSRLWRRLRKAGVDVRAFNPPRLTSPLGWLSRDHRKTLSVDGEIAFVTGLCVGDAWVGDPAANLEPWRDTGVALRGPAVESVEAAFASVWSTTGSPLPQSERLEPGSVAQVGDVALRVIATEPVTAGTFRVDHLVSLLARERLWIADAYFVPLPVYAQALIAAAVDGVDVRILVPGGSDLPLVKPFTLGGYRALLDGGVRVFEWNGSMMHAKTAVADGRWARIGSSNVNIQSWLGNWELDVAIEDYRIGRAMEKMYESDLTRSTEIVLADRQGHLERVGPRTVAPRRARGSRSRAAKAGSLRLGSTFGAALTRRRALGRSDAFILVYGAVLIGAVGAASILWPKAFAWPFAAVALWLAISWLLQALGLVKHARRKKREADR
jgi:cardiolipin synthase A/B